MGFRKFGIAWCFALALCAGARADDKSVLPTLEAIDFSPALVERIHQARVLPIAFRFNQGTAPKCGFYALSHAMHAFDSAAPSGETLYQTAYENGWLWDDNGATVPRNLFLTMQAHGYRGEYGWGAQGGTIAYLKKLLRTGFSVVLAVRGVSNAGLPEHPGMFHVGGHWVALEGFVEIDGVEYLIIKDSNHYWSEPKYVNASLDGSTLWPRKQFEAAWSYWSYVAITPAE